MHPFETSSRRIFPPHNTWLPTHSFVPALPPSLADLRFLGLCLKKGGKEGRREGGRGVEISKRRPFHSTCTGPGREEGREEGKEEEKEEGREGGRVGRPTGERQAGLGLFEFSRSEEVVDQGGDTVRNGRAVGAPETENRTISITTITNSSSSSSGDSSGSSSSRRRRGGGGVGRREGRREGGGVQFRQEDGVDGGRTGGREGGREGGC